VERASVAGQLALWVGRKGKGSAFLRWDQSQLVLHVVGLQIVAVEGDDGSRLSATFGRTDGGEWFSQAAGAVAAGQLTQGEANAVVKRALAERLREFFLAPDGEASFESDAALAPGTLTISFPHLVVEMILGSGGEDLVDRFLPDPTLLIRRLPDFPKRVGALGLTQEAMAILAKINDQRSALEIADPSPHGRELALRLLAAAAGAGLVEMASKIAEVPLASTPPPHYAAPARRRWWPVVLGLLAVAAAVTVLLFIQAWRSAKVVGGGGPWAVAVDGGCQPAELERLYRRQEQDKVNFQVVPFGQGTGQCYRLAWGRFPTKEAAAAVIPRLPQGTVARGFPPHVVRIEGPSP
jgi:hypothetical protein